MRKNIRLFILLFSVLASIVLSIVEQHIPVYAASLNWEQKGMSIFPYGTNDYSTSNYQQTLRNLAQTGANYVSLILPYYQSSTSSTTIFGGWNTLTDSSLISGIQYAHSLGLHVMLKPHVDTQDGNWRAYISPSNKAAWFSSYGNLMNHLGTIAAANNVEEISIGAELISLSTYTSDPANTGYWDTLIANLRSIYSGKLTYSANWGEYGFVDEKNHIAFWDKLDAIGISAYFDLTNHGDASVSELETAWSQYQTDITSLHNKFNKPVLFTEIGYRSVYGANIHPWDDSAHGTPDMTEQSNDFTALFDYWSNYSWMIGVQIWQWDPTPTAGGTGNDWYTTQNKPAQNVIKQWFTSTGTVGNPTFSVNNVSSNPAPLVNNVQGMVSATVKTLTGSATNAIVDFEVYNSANAKVYQQFFSNQTLSQGQTNPYSIQWTPNAIGAYHLAVGVFTGDWSTNYLWNGNAGALSVIANGGTPTPTPTATPTPTQTPTPTPTPTPVSTSLSIWWPTNGSTVSGVQPFKAVMNGMNVGDYTMYLQVDGGQLNLMQSVTATPAHKESSVNVSGWNWKGNGPYTINFIAKDGAGNVLGQKSVNIMVSH